MPESRDSASLVGVHGSPRAARAVARGLRALAPRGGGAAGVVALGELVRARREPRDAFLADEPALDALGGDVAVGERHARDASDDARLGLVDGVRLPRVARLAEGPVAVAVSGAIVGAGRLARELVEQGAPLAGEDPEALLLELIGRSRQRTLVNRLVDALWRLDGGFSVLLAAPGLLVGVRDRRGLRPLVLGRAEGVAVLATEEAAVVAAGATPVRAVAPGEMVIVDAQGVTTVRPFPARPASPCALEWARLAQPSSGLDGLTAATLRERLGVALTDLSKVHVDVLVASEPAAAPATAGLSRVIGVPAVPGLAEVVPGTLRGAVELVAGRVVMLVAPELSAALRDAVEALLGAGAADVHVRVATPRPVRACAYGVDAAAPELGAEDALAAGVGARSLAFLPVAAFVGAFRGASWTPCAACLGEPWPIAPVDEAEEQLPLFGKDGG